jgi:hypothetical protein
MWDAYCMRRILLIAALVVLLFIDISIVPMTLLLIILGGLFGAVGQVGHWLPLSLFSLALGGSLLWLTALIWKALQASSGERPITR